MPSDPANEARRVASGQGPTARRRASWIPTDLGAGSRSEALAAAVLLAVLTALWVWWGLSKGAYFPIVYLPGAALLYATLIMLLLAAPSSLAARGPHVLAVAALFGLATWTALSLLWSPAKDLALEDAQRSVIYAAVLFAGVWLGVVTRKRPGLALAPWVVAAAVIAAVTIIQIIGADSGRGLFDTEETLEYPFQYRNANAAFFVISTLITVSVVARRSTPVALGGLLTGVAVACLCLAILCQSRGSVLAAAAGTFVLLIAHPLRLRVAAIIAVVALPALVALPEFLDPYAADDRRVALVELKEAGRLIPFAALGGAVIALPVQILFRRRDRVRTRPPRRFLPRRAVALLVGLLIAIGTVAAIVVAGDRLGSGADGETSSPRTRYTYTGGLNRTDFWAVALEQFTDAPLIGGGSGSFRTRYALDRESPELPRDAHSLEMETLGELGLVGVALLLLAGLAVGAGIIRSARLGADGAVRATALAAATAWLAQASVDWFSSFPGLTAPVIALVGLAMAPAAMARGDGPRRSARWLVAALLTLTAIAAVPQFVSDRLTFRAAGGWQSDPDSALDALDTAADLNPLADAPLLVEAEIARQIDDPDRALEALAEAHERQPDEWLTYLLRAEILRLKGDVPGARRALEEAKQRNPLEPEVTELEDELGVSESRSRRGD